MADQFLMSYEKLKIKYPECPFVWHYDDMGNIYPVEYIDKVSSKKICDIVDCSNNEIVKELFKIPEFENADCYVVAQYKQDQIYYNSTVLDEIYISYHTWLYKHVTQQNEIKDCKTKIITDINCGVFPLIGNIEHIKGYPFIMLKDRKHRTHKVDIGLAINNLIKRECIIHDAKGYIRFSPHNECNIKMNDDCDNYMFISAVYCDDIKKSCITLHIFRNKTDNNTPCDENFKEMISLIKN